MGFVQGRDSHDPLHLPPPPASWDEGSFLGDQGRLSFANSEQLIKAMADRLAADGWKKLGYEYVTLDDCWAAGKRDALGRLQADPQRFPSGMKALADYVSAVEGLP